MANGNDGYVNPNIGMSLSLSFLFIESIFQSVNAEKDKQEAKDKAYYAKKGAGMSVCLCLYVHV